MRLDDSTTERVCETCRRHYRAPPSRIARGERVRFCGGVCKNKWESRPLLERIAEKSTVDEKTGCYLFGGCKIRGYGRLFKAAGGAKTFLVHRLAYEILVGPIPDGLDVCHNCPGGDNRACFNPGHLWLGTNDENVQDAVDKGRILHGQQSPRAKLTADQVREIRLLFASGVNDHEIGRRFGVHSTSIRYIRIGRNWRHVA